MTNQGSGRTRGRWARLAALSLTTILTSGLAAPAMAQSPHPNLDANGVDLTDGKFNLRLPIASVGSGQAELVLVAYDGQKDNWTQATAIKGTSGSNIWVQVRLGTLYDEFSFANTGTSGTSTKGTGATIEISSLGAVYRTLDGEVYTFEGESNDGWRTNMCSDLNTSNCTMLARTVSGKSGMTVSYGWNTHANCSNIPNEDETLNCNITFRLEGVSNDAGYGIVWGFATDSEGTFRQNPPADWFRRTSAALRNGTTTVGTVTYAAPSAGVSTITTPGGKTWRIANSGNTITGLRRPSASSDTTTISYSGTTVTSVTRDGITTGYNYSLSGTTATMVVTDAQSNTTTIVSDITKGRPTSVTDGRGKTTTMTWDSVGRPDTITFPEGNKIVHGYDSRGNLQITTRKAKTGSGLSDTYVTADFDSTCTNIAKCNSPNWVQDALGNRTDYTYDSTTGLLLSETAPAATTGAKRPQTRYSYTTNSAGVTLLTGVSQCQTGATSDTPSCVGTADEVKTTVAYDANLNVTSVTKADGATTPTLSVTTASTYDLTGNLLTVDGPLSGSEDTTTFRYDADRNRVGAISADPDGAGARKRRAVKTSYNTDGQPTTVEIGNVNGTSDTDWAAFASAQQVTSTYDTNARKTKDVLTASATTYQVAQYTYDTLGRLDCSALRMNSAVWGSLPSSACTLGTAGSFGNDRITKTSYDAVGHVTKVQTGYGVTGVQADEVATTYTDNGNVLSVTDAEGNRTGYSYDGFDRLSKTSYPSTTKGAGTSSSTDYEELIYNAADKVTSRRLRGYSSDSSKHIDYGYDNLGRMKTKDLPGSELDVTYGYDLLSRPTSVATSAQTLTFGYDALGRNTSQGGPLGTVSYQYDAASRRKRITWPDSLYVTYDYQVTGEMTAIRENGATSGVGVLATYVYDDLGRRTTLTRGNGTVSTSGYDNVSRLASLALNLDGATTTNDVTTTFGYSPANQVSSQLRTNDGYAWGGHANVARNYTSNGLNQFTVSGSRTLTYDARGNLWKDQLTGAPTSGTEYIFDSQNLPTTIRTTAATPVTIATLNYDPVLRLYETNTPAPTTARFLYDGSRLIGEYNAAGTLQKRYVHGSGSDEPIVEYTGSGTGSGVRTFFHADERGSIVARSNESGAKTIINSYDEFGIPANGNIGRFQYTGQTWLPEVGLYNYKARLYSPTLGRFMQTDPIGHGGGMNIYGYVDADPVNQVDPSGLCPAGEVWVVATGSHIGHCVSAEDAKSGPPSGSGGIAPGFSPGVRGLGALRGWRSGYWSCDNCNVTTTPAGPNEILVLGWIYTWHPTFSFGSGYSYGNYDRDNFDVMRDCNLVTNYCGRYGPPAPTPQQKKPELKYWEKCLVNALTNYQEGVTFGRYGPDVASSATNLTKGMPGNGGYFSATGTSDAIVAMFFSNIGWHIGRSCP